MSYGSKAGRINYNRFAIPSSETKITKETRIEMLYGHGISFMLILRHNLERYSSMAL
jgi:hypothetical protein